MTYGGTNAALPIIAGVYADGGLGLEPGLAPVRRPERAPRHDRRQQRQLLDRVLLHRGAGIRRPDRPRPPEGTDSTPSTACPAVLLTRRGTPASTSRMSVDACGVAPLRQMLFAGRCPA